MSFESDPLAGGAAGKQQIVHLQKFSVNRRMDGKQRHLTRPDMEGFFNDGVELVVHRVIAMDQSNSVWMSGHELAQVVVHFSALEALIVAELRDFENRIFRTDPWLPFCGNACFDMHGCCRRADLPIRRKSQDDSQHRSAECCEERQAKPALEPEESQILDEGRPDWFRTKPPPDDPGEVY